MAVRPMKVNPDGGVDVWHDEREHGGTIPVNQLSFGPGVGGGVDWRYIQVPCPVEGCGSVSLHPIAGGVDAPRVQFLFARVLKRLGTIPPGVVTRLGLPSGDVSTWPKARDAVEFLTERMDGPRRFRLKDIKEDDEP